MESHLANLPKERHMYEQEKIFQIETEIERKQLQVRNTEHKLLELEMNLFNTALDANSNFFPFSAHQVTRICHYKKREP